MAISLTAAVVMMVKRGQSGRAGLLAARAEGVQVRDATWFRLVGEVRRALANQIGEASAPLNRRPIGQEISTLSTKVAKGFVQYVDVYVRDRASGIVARRYFAVRSPTLLTRQAVIGRALTSFTTFTAGPDASYAEQVLGAIYTATYQMQPTL